jgi:hypothetical protein
LVDQSIHAHKLGLSHAVLKACAAPARNNIQDVGNILGALYLSMLFLGIINSRTVQPVAANERSVSRISALNCPSSVFW